MRTVGLTYDDVVTDDVVDNKANKEIQNEEPNEYANATSINSSIPFISDKAEINKESS